MSIRFKTSLWLSSVFTVIYTIVCISILFVFSVFRKEEFKQRLSEQALTIITLLTEVQQVDQHILRIIDEHTINRLYDEKTLIFDANYKLIYSSLDDTWISWSVNDLKYLEENNIFFKKDGQYEIYGFFYDTTEEDFFALVSANDKYGKRMLWFLAWLMLFSFLVFVVTIWIVTFYLIKKQLDPLVSFQQKIKIINEKNLEQKFEAIPGKKDEISMLADEFNLLMSRISDAYQKQKEFTSQASHELRTPLARILAKMDNQLENMDKDQKDFLINISSDIAYLNEIINSLLVLTRIDTLKNNDAEISRLDEIIYNAIDKTLQKCPNLKVVLDMDNIDDLDKMLFIKANSQLMEIAFKNLLQNACIYSDDHKAVINIRENREKLILTIGNRGKTLTVEEQKKLFQAFMRGENAKDTNGVGLGLRIVFRILDFYGYKIHYKASPNWNEFSVNFN